MKRLYHQYWSWEDYKNGMYSQNDLNESDVVKNCIKLLTDLDLFYKNSILVIENWIISTEENLTNKSNNRRAWIGQSACCYYCKANEKQTKLAWKTITDKQKTDANLLADKIIKIYETKNRKIYSQLGKEMLF
jgi:hypothetical protein